MVLRISRRPRPIRPGARTQAGQRGRAARAAGAELEEARRVQGFVEPFATNHGSNLTTVFSGPTSLPATVAPFPAFEAPVPFTTPFLLLATSASSVAIETINATNMWTGAWAPEIHDVVRGDAPSPSMLIRQTWPGKG